MNILITILARAGSKGCPGKAVRPCAGKPLIRWTKDQANQFASFMHSLGGHKVLSIVSSDSPEVFAATGTVYALQSRCWRPPELATDTAPKVPAIRHALQSFEEKGKPVDVIIDLDVTAPLRTLDDIHGALELFLRKKPDCVMSCTVGVGRNPYFNLLELMIPKNPGSGYGPGLCRSKKGLPIHNRQEAPDVYEANSSIYVYSREFLLRGDVQSPLDGVCIPYVMPDVSFFHVDSLLDFDIVEFLLKRRGV